ncbi:MAG: phenylpropionate dioxygenase-like ring-hydroxylating dioxygenase large terminal subunit [Kiritimatiellia bacterium]|jgi:phenylpropionate dioxygenase-like ring-hydroxylating dioxygenase large terminal subunit
MTELPANAWYAVARENAVAPGPESVSLLGTPLVLFRSSNGVVALEDRCPHRCAALSEGTVCEGTLRCGYHGWRFDGSGACVQVPGLPELSPSPSRSASTRPVQTHLGLVWVWAGDAEPDEPLPGHTNVSGPTSSFTLDSSSQGDVLDALENLLDPLHTHFVHPGAVRTEGKRSPIEVVVRAFEDGVEAHYQPEPRERGRLMRWFGGGIGTSAGRYRWPSVAELVYDGPDGTPRFVVHAAFCPCEGDRMQVFATVTGKTSGLPATLAIPVLRRMFQSVVDQDAKAVRQQLINRQRWPNHVDQSTEGDLLRGPMQRFLREGPGAQVRERKVTLWI